MRTATDEDRHERTIRHAEGLISRTPRALEHQKEQRRGHVEDGDDEHEPNDQLYVEVQHGEPLEQLGMIVHDAAHIQCVRNGEEDAVRQGPEVSVIPHPQLQAPDVPIVCSAGESNGRRRHAMAVHPLNPRRIRKGLSPVADHESGSSTPSNGCGPTTPIRPPTGTETACPPRRSLDVANSGQVLDDLVRHPKPRRDAPPLNLRWCMPQKTYSASNSCKPVP